MKKGWVIKPLGDVFETVTGNTPSKSNADYYGRHIPLVKPPELQDCELSDAEDGLSEEGARVARVAPPSSILVSCIGNLGKIGFNTVPVAFNQQINAIIPDRSHAIPEFFFYQVLSCRFRDQLESLASGTTVSIVNKSRFNSIEIVLPPLSEQQRIVGILDEAFGGLATAQAHAAQNLQNARDLFESHLNAVFTQRGDGWVEKRLGDIGTTQTGSTPKTSDLSNYGSLIPFIKPGDFNPDGTLDYENEGLSKEGLDAARRVAAKSVLMVCIGATIGKCGYCDRDVTTNQQINALTPLPDINHLFMYFQMLTADFQHRVRSNAGQATLPIISKGKWNDLTVVVPASLDEQKHIAAQLDALSSETQRLARIYEKKLESLGELKKSLLHQAFSGEL